MIDPRRLLSLAPVYEAFQHAVGAGAARDRFLRSYVGVQEGMRVLDLGCGTGAIARAMPPGVHYVGVDGSDAYLDAGAAPAGLEHFELRQGFFTPSWELPSDLRAFDRVMLVGVFHHLDDATVRNVARQSARALRGGGLMVSIDPARVEGQSPIARALVDRDRGEYVRDPLAYEGLVAPAFARCRRVVSHDMLRIPYAHCLLVAEPNA